MMKSCCKILQDLSNQVGNEAGKRSSILTGQLPSISAPEPWRCVWTGTEGVAVRGGAVSTERKVAILTHRLPPILAWGLSVRL